MSPVPPWPVGVSDLEGGPFAIICRHVLSYGYALLATQNSGRVRIAVDR